jgi:NAD(P)-dependent dehydrogenase (short-subunit alcohol dehydrogenase family)
MGKPQNATSVEMSLLRESFEVNFFGLVQATILFLPLLRKSPHSVILNVTTDMASNTLQASRDFLHFAAYNTPKAAVNSYTIALAHELKSEGIKVNCVTPGFTTTKLNNFAPGGKTPIEAAQVLVPWALLGPDGPTGMLQSIIQHSDKCPKQTTIREIHWRTGY